MVKRITFIGAFFVVVTGFSQEIQESIPWSESFRLSWDDFRGTIPPDASAAATTASGISYNYSANLMFNEVTLDFEVNAFFYPQESWYRPAVCDSIVLSHEQLHFDITELYARRMRKKLREATFSNNVKAEIRDIYNRTIKELSTLQERYDWETDFSRNREAQLRWERQIAEALELVKE